MTNTTKVQTGGLPDKPSELLRIALEDLEKVEKLPLQYQVEMDEWHNPSNGVCEVCLAGSVMAMRLGAQPGEGLHPALMGQVLRDKMFAINSLRVGEVDDALLLLGLDSLEGSLDRRFTGYEYDPIAFKEQMETLASDLENLGY